MDILDLIIREKYVWKPLSIRLPSFNPPSSKKQKVIAFSRI